MEIFKKVLRIILIVLFPLGIIFCIGKNLFSGNFVSFLGGVLLFGLGFLLALWTLRPDLVEPIKNFFGG